MFVYPRAGYSLDRIFSEMQKITDVEEVDISSDKIKKMNKLGKSINAFITLEIVEYIDSNKLYK